jgi:DNA replication ATP-dependent helicase Dna2
VGEAARTVVETLRAALGASGEPAHLLVAPAGAGKTAELVLLQRQGVTLIEALPAAGKVRGAGHGIWEMDGAPLDPERANPYQRLRARRALWLDHLERHKRRFLTPERADGLRIEQVRGWVLLTPGRHPGTLLEIDRRERWFRVVGLSELSRSVADVGAGAPVFAAPDLEALTAHLTGANGWGANGFASWPDSNCPVCRLGGDPCGHWRLAGAVTDLEDRELAEGRRLVTATLTTALRYPVRVILNAPWDRLALPLRALLGERTRDPAATWPRLALYHLEERAHAGTLSYATGARSLVVLEPEMLLNVNELGAFRACPMRYLIARFVAGSPSPDTVRGNLVHEAFRQALRDTDDGAVLHHALAACLDDLAATAIPADVLLTGAEPHLAKLRALLAQQLPANGRALSEPAVFSPALGMNGRIDAIWEAAGGHVTGVVELKTGKPRTGRPSGDGDRFQVQAYGAMLHAQGRLDDPASALRLFYTGGEQPAAESVPLGGNDLWWIVRRRNGAAMLELLGKLDTAMQGCRNGCPPFSADPCRLLRFLLEIGMDSATETYPLANGGRLSAADRAFFRHYYDLLLRERRRTHAEAGAAYIRTVEERIAAGTCVRLDPGRLPEPEPTDDGRFRYEFSADNQSELRAGDWVLVGAGELDGQVIRAEIAAIRQQEDTPGRSRIGLLVSERLRNPRVIDRNESADALDRSFEALYRWLQAEDRLRALVRRERPPRFAPTPPLASARATYLEGLNPSQGAAIERALAAEDYALIWGPPGTGKTKVIARLAAALIGQGRRVLLSAFTNQAIDNLGGRLLDEGIADFRFLTSRPRSDARLDAHLLPARPSLRRRT